MLKRFSTPSCQRIIKITAARPHWFVWSKTAKHAIDHGKSVGVLSTDMSKAFDTMYPTLLLAKLKAYGFSEGAVSLMRSFFEERKGRTKLGTAVSE